MTEAVQRSGPVAVQAWEHTSYSVENIKEAVRFYRDALGFDVVWHGRDWRDDIQTYLGTSSGVAEIVMLRSPVSSHIIEFIKFEEVPDAVAAGTPVRPGTGHVAFRVADVEVAAAQLVERGAVLLGGIQVSPGVGRGCYLRVPGGTVIELTDLAEGVPQVGSAEYIAKYGAPAESFDD